MRAVSKKYDFESKTENTLFPLLPQKEREFLEKKAKIFRFSNQEMRILCEIARDLQMWREGSIEEIWPQIDDKRELFKRVRKNYERIKNLPKSYENFSQKEQGPNRVFVEVADKDVGFGMCPVASPKTRCCNLWTLDVVESCGYDCSYCSIQSFYNQDKVTVISDLKNKLSALKLDPDQIYHIGTGQSSDSLMWGNLEGILDALIDFAKRHPNVILELKTKSDNVSYLLKNEYPPNIIVTWSLNPQKIVESEERLSAPLDKRLKAAKKIADKGRLVGFHFHPMIHYAEYKRDYKIIFDRLVKEFDPKSVAMVSFGTLTFIKPVIRQLRARGSFSKILQMPMEDAAGKLSYPAEIKKEMFSFAYNALSQWHGKVFFYLCMEDHSLWREVLAREYPTNESFELDMKYSYMAKINSLE